MGTPWLSIAGAGLCGLSVAEALAAHPQLPGPVYLFDPRSQWANDQTFCFWDKRPISDPRIAYSYSSWSFGRRMAQPVIQHDETWHYHCVPARQVWSRALAAIESHPQIHLFKGQKLNDWPQGSIFRLDTRPAPQQKFLISQVFLGFELRGAHGQNVGRVGLMLDLHCGACGPAFLYLLPMGSDRILAEWTVFSPRPFDPGLLEAELRAALCRYGLEKLQVGRREQGCIPMGLDHQPPGPTGNLLRAGAGAGMTRASSGYGYTAIRHFATEAAQSLLTRRRWPQVQGLPSWVRWMDRQLLWVIREKPEQVADIFMDMATGMSGEEFARFMSRPDFGAALAVIRAAPPLPFLQAALHSTPEPALP